MKSILEELNQEVGVKGSLIVTHDGVVVTSALGVGLQEDRVAAVASAAIQSIRRALATLHSEGFSRFILNASDGKLVIEETGNAFLVVVLDRRINLDVTLIAISGAAYRIRNQAQIRA